MIEAGTETRAWWRGDGLGQALRRSSMPLVLLLVAVGLLNLYFMASRVHFLVDFSEASYSPYFWAKRFGLFLHVWGGLAALGCGLAQIWLGQTGQTGVLHRRLGWVYVVGVAISVAAAVQMALTIPGHFAYASGLFMNAVVWGVATVIALLAVRRGRIDVHREWMLRSYVLALAFTMARMMLPLLRPLVNVEPDPIATDMQAAVAWACWVLPLFLFEIGLSWRALRRAS